MKPTSEQQQQQQDSFQKTGTHQMREGSYGRKLQREQQSPNPAAKRKLLLHPPPHQQQSQHLGASQASNTASFVSNGGLPISKKDELRKSMTSLQTKASLSRIKTTMSQKIPLLIQSQQQLAQLNAQGAPTAIKTLSPSNLQGSKKKMKLTTSKVVLSSQGAPAPDQADQKVNMRSYSKSQIGLNQASQQSHQVFSPIAEVELAGAVSKADSMQRTVTTMSFNQLDGGARMLKSSFGIPLHMTQTLPEERFAQAYRSEKGLRKIAGNNEGTASVFSQHPSALSQQSKVLQVKRHGGELKIASQALTAAQAKTSSYATEQHSPARESNHHHHEQQPPLLKDVVKMVYMTSQKAQMPKGAQTSTASLMSTPAFKHEKNLSVVGGKRMSVALIPARRDHPSPLRSSQDNLVTAAYHSTKGSFVAATSQSQLANAPNFKAVSSFGSKRNSVSKTSHQPDLEAQPIYVHFVEGKPAALTESIKPNKSRKNSVSHAALAPQSQVGVSEQIMMLQDQLAQLSSQTGAAPKPSKADRGPHYTKKSKKAQLHESGQFSPTTSKLIKHFLSKQQKVSSALKATLGSEKKSISRKTSFLNHKDFTPAPGQLLQSNNHPQRKQKDQNSYYALHATQSQRSTKQRKQSAQSHKKQHQQVSGSKEVYRTMIPPSGSNFAIAAKAEQSSQPRQAVLQLTQSQQHSAHSKKGSKRQGSAHKIHLTDKHLPYKSSLIGSIAHSGSSRKLVVEKVKPPLQKNNYMTSTSSPRQQPQKLMIRQSKKHRDSQQSSIDHQAAGEKKMAFSQSVQQLERNQGALPPEKEPKLTVKRIKRDQTNKEQLMRSLEKLQMKQVRASVAKEPKSHQVSASDASSVIQAIVSINKHPYFGGDTFSDQNGGADSEKLAQHQHDLLLNSDTNAQAVTNDQSRSKHREAKHSQSTKHQQQEEHGPGSSKRVKERSTHIVSPSNREPETTDRAHLSFEPYSGGGKQPILSPINQQSLFDNVNSLTNNQTNLFSGRSSGEKLRALVQRMSDQAQPNAATSKEVIESLEAMQKIISEQECLIRQFQRDVERQEGVITRYEKHIKQLETAPVRSAPVQEQQQQHQSGSEFTDRESSSLRNPSSHYNQQVPLQRQCTDVLPTTHALSQSDIDIDNETVKQHNLTQKSSQSHQMVTRNLTATQGKSRTEQATTVNGLSESRLVLLEQQERFRLKLRKREKREKLLKQKINKLMFFFFTLQNKGVPVNEIYEQEGIKAIRTDRFDEIMAQIARDNGEVAVDQKKDVDSDDQYSFYSDDSYEYMPRNPDISMLPYRRPDRVPALKLEDLPDYVSTSDEEAEEEEEEEEGNTGVQQPQTSELEAAIQATSQGDTHLQRESMSQTDYRQSLQYIENFYQKHQNAKSPNSSSRQNMEDGMVELAECPAQLSLKQLNSQKEAAAKAAGGPNPLESPQNMSDAQLGGDQSAVDIVFERCSSAQLGQRDDHLDMLNQVTDFKIAETVEDEEQNASSLQMSLLSSPSKKPSVHHQASHSMVNARGPHMQSTGAIGQNLSHKFQLSNNKSSAGLMERGKSQASQQSQSQLESIDMVLSHDQQTAPGGVHPTHGHLP